MAQNWIIAWQRTTKSTEHALSVGIYIHLFFTDQGEHTNYDSSLTMHIIERWVYLETEAGKRLSCIMSARLLWYMEKAEVNVSSIHTQTDWFKLLNFAAQSLRLCVSFIATSLLWFLSSIGATFEGFYLLRYFHMSWDHILIFTLHHLFHNYYCTPAASETWQAFFQCAICAFWRNLSLKLILFQGEEL